MIGSAVKTDIRQKQQTMDKMWHHLPSARVCQLLEVLTGDSACPLDLPEDENEVKDESTEDEDDTVQVLHGRLVDDRSNN